MNNGIDYDENLSPFSSFCAYLGIAVFLLLIGVLLYLLIPIKEKVTITGFSWDWEIKIEQLTTVEESGWYPPSNARIKDKQYRYHGQHKELSGFDSDGNPIYWYVDDYDYYYTYDVDKWVFDRNIITQANDKTPYEPSYTLGDEERVSSSEVTYRIHTDDKIYTTSKDIFNKAEIGAYVTIKHRRHSDKILEIII